MNLLNVVSKPKEPYDFIGRSVTQSMLIVKPQACLLKALT